MTHLILVSLKCDRLNQTIDVSTNTEAEIEAIISKYDKTKWIILKR